MELLEAWDGTVGVDAQMDYVRARFTSGTDRNVPRIPPLRWGLGLFYKGDHAQARFGFLRTERQSRVSDNETPTSGFTFVDATVTIGLGAWIPGASSELLLQATNLLDEKARNVVSFTADEVLLPGRSFRAAVRLPF